MLPERDDYELQKFTPSQPCHITLLPITLHGIQVSFEVYLKFRREGKRVNMYRNIPRTILLGGDGPNMNGLLTLLVVNSPSIACKGLRLFKPTVV